MNSRVSTLENGLTVITTHTAGREAVQVYYFVNVGSRDDPPGKEGWAHFYEHVCLGDTFNQSAKDIRRDLGELAIYHNAGVGKEDTYYELYSAKEDIGKSISTLAEFILAPALKEEQIEKEKMIILQELHRALDNEQYCFDRAIIQKAIQNRGFQHSGLGTESSIKGIDKAELQKFHQKHMTGANSVLSVAGDVNHDEIVELAETYFKGLNRGKPPRKRREALSFQGGNVIHANNDKHTATISIAFPGPDQKAKDYEAIKGLAKVLDGGFSRLSESIREEAGLVYTINIAFSTYQGGSLFYLDYQTDYDSVIEAFERSLQEIYDIAENGISEQELQSIKERHAKELRMRYDDIDCRAMDAGQSILNGLSGNPYKEAERFDNLGVDDIRQAAIDLLTNDHLTIGLKGDVSEELAQQMRVVYDQFRASVSPSAQRTPGSDAPTP